MNWQHLQTFLWLRWRLRSNQRKRSGALAGFIEALVTVISACAAFVGLGLGFLFGFFALRTTSPLVLLLVWDGVVAAFLFLWSTELLVELQRSELLSLERFLHLPVSLTSVFLINYVGSMFCMAGIFFLPGMVGLSIGLVLSRGWTMILMVPLVASLALAVTAITYQFRGWLASLMFNQRRRRTIIAFASIAFMLLTQLPNIWNMTRSRSNRESSAQARRDKLDLERSLAAGTITPEEYARRTTTASRSGAGALEEARRPAELASLAIPFGWTAV